MQPQQMWQRPEATAVLLLLLLLATPLHGVRVSPDWPQTSVPPSPGIATGGTNLFSLFLSLRNASDNEGMYPEQGARTAA